MHSAVLLLFVGGLPAQSNTLSVAPSAAASGIGTNSTVTGVPRYRTGFRESGKTSAPATQDSLSTVGGSATANHDASLPIVTIRNNDLGIAAGTPIEVHLDQTVDSAHAVNGQTLRGKLVKAAGDAPAGSPVELTVVAVAAAGQMSSAGELSLQIVRIHGQDALSQVITAQGQQGPRLTADAAPARGTEASISANQTLIFPAS
jgi:hypothetical protein